MFWWVWSFTICYNNDDVHDVECNDDHDNNTIIFYIYKDILNYKYIYIYISMYIHDDVDNDVNDYDDDLYFSFY